jgi:hypothetical protein
MSVEQVITVLASVIQGISRVSKLTRETIAESCEELARKVRSGELLPDELISSVEKDNKTLEDITRRLK